MAKFSQPEEVEPFIPAKEHRREEPIKWWRSLGIILVIVCAAIAVLFAGGRILTRALTPASVLDRFWAPVLETPGTIWISIGDDKPHARELRGTTGRIDSGTPFSSFLEQQPTSPIMDLTAASGITAFLAQRGKTYSIQVAQTMTLADLRGAPVVLLGTFRNDWAVRLGSDFRFQFRDSSAGGVNWIQDVTIPANKTWVVDLSSSYDQVQKDYALVDRVFDPKTGKLWIGIAGLTGLGTVAAQQLLTDPKAMSALADRLPHEWEHKNLQIVLEIPIVKGSAGSPSAIAMHSW